MAEVNFNTDAEISISDAAVRYAESHEAMFKFEPMECKHCGNKGAIFSAVNCDDEACWDCIRTFGFVGVFYK